VERADRTVRRLLGNVAEARAARHLDRAFVRIELADEDFHQRRLAGAVAPDQPDTATRRDRGRGAIEDRAAAEAHSDGVDGDHCGAPPSSASPESQTWSGTWRRARRNPVRNWGWTLPFTCDPGRTIGKIAAKARPMAT